jgi:hypothetical protein
MRVARHVHLADPSHHGLRGVRRSAVLAVATFAALVTLLLPGPALARPANLTGGSVATTGGVAASATTHTGRRTRGEQSSSPRSSAGPTSTPGADASAAAAVLTASHGAGPTLTAALNGSSGAVIPTVMAAGPPGPDRGTVASLAGSRTSRAPPTA